MLDDLIQIAKVDKSDAFGFVAKQPEQLSHEFGFDSNSFTDRPIYNVVFSGMGGSSLVAELAQSWPQIKEPFVINKGYGLPNWVDQDTLVICASYSGNTEETLSSLKIAKQAGAQIAILAHGGELLETAKRDSMPYAEIPESTQPRTAVLYMYRALVELLVACELVPSDSVTELESVIEPLKSAIKDWVPEKLQNNNYAKQLANQMLGKTPIIYGGPLTYPAAYKWKINVNENAKNTAWCNQLSEFNHNEFIGWTSHPVEKPFAVIDLISSFEDPRVLKRFKVSDKMLSGKRPKAIEVEAKGESILEQLLYLVILSDFATSYLAVLNNVDPSPVDLVEKFKKELNN